MKNIVYKLFLSVSMVVSFLIPSQADAFSHANIIPQENLKMVNDDGKLYFSDAATADMGEEQLAAHSSHRSHSSHQSHKSHYSSR